MDAWKVECAGGNQQSCKLYEMEFARLVAIQKGLDGNAAALNAAANWAVRQQNTTTYSGGSYGRPFGCTKNSITGQTFCY